MSIQYFTLDGLEKLKKDLNQLISVERPSISQQIADARDKGDLSENAEYDAAKHAQGMLELRISQLEETIRNARIIDESMINISKVSLLSTIELKDLKTNKIVKYSIVPENETDAKNRKISVKTPIAQGLLGKEKGDIVEIKIPAGTKTFEIMDITRF